MRRLLLPLLLILTPLLSICQCPVTNSCSPGIAPSSVFPFGMGIYNVTVGGATGFTNPTSLGASDGYKDYSCTKKATLKEGVSTTISVSTNVNSDENVRVWIDLNNNGTFEAASELVFTSNNARQHTGTITIPVSAAVVKNTVLRMRVSADDNGSPIPTPCSTPKFSQVEDYGITVQANTSKPTVDFTVNNPITCTPTVQFTELTQNGATSFLWSFGDNTTSTAANPTHTYAAPGLYTVKLKACNANGCDSLTKTNFVTYHNNVPIAAACTPVTLNYCCGYGINTFTLHTLTNNSQVGNSGFEDFTCTKSITLMENNSYPVALTSLAANLQDAWIYIDYNNDGIFTSNELAFSKLATLNPSGIITVKPGATKNIPLRLRVIADSQGSLSDPCSNRTNGQVEDYSIIIIPNTNKPVVDFSSNFTTLCDSMVQFSDNSLNGPTSWQWDFGDGTTQSNQQNPQHLFTATGAFTIKLKACNTNGCDSLVKKHSIYIRKPCPQYCTPLGNSSTSALLNVSLNTINNSSGVETSGYGSYLHISTKVTKGTTYSFSSTTNLSGSQIYAWIDYNQDGDFDDFKELVAFGIDNLSLTKNIQIPIYAKSGPTRMRVVSAPKGVFVTPCKNGSTTETEDYTISILPNNQPPTAYFTTYNQYVCTNTVLLTDTSANSPTSWNWDFGDPISGSNNTSSLESPVHTFSAPGSYTITLTVCNEYGCNTITKPNYLTVGGIQGPRSISCQPITISKKPSDMVGIYNVILNTINHSSPAGNGYEDYSCTQQTTLLQGLSYSITVNTGPIENSYVKIWIDYNNDAIFNPTSELIYVSSSSKKLHNATFSVPANAQLNVPLRLRIAADINGSFFGPCDAALNGQIEDYTVTIVTNTGKPTPSFLASSYASCNPLLSFSDQSIGNPTSWNWNFGDPLSGTTNNSVLQNPNHTFSGPGNYKVTLNACNGAGCNSQTQIISIISQPNPKAGCTILSSANIAGEGIFNVKFLNVNQTSGNSSEGYRDFTCISNAITTPGSFLLTVQTNPTKFESLKAYIDFNNDGNFSGTGEEVMSTLNRGLHTGIVVVPTTAVKNTWLRFRIIDKDQSLSSTNIFPCGTTIAGQAEDYALMVQSKLNLITNIVGIKEDKDNLSKQVIIYPNPGDGTFFLEIPSVFKGSYQIEVQNLTGQKVAGRTLLLSEKTIPLDLGFLPKGLYMLKIYNSEDWAITKILIE